MRRLREEEDDDERDDEENGNTSISVSACTCFVGPVQLV